MRKCIRRFACYLLVAAMLFGFTVTASAACPYGDDCPCNEFNDVSFSSWYHESIAYVVKYGLMGGTSDGSFNPQGKLTRAMMAQLLFNISGTPTEYMGIFSDVAQGSWYSEAVEWAASSGIVGGYTDGTFHPSSAITRQDLVVMVYNYAKAFCHVGGEYDTSVLATFCDADQISSYAVQACAWAVGAKIIGGTKQGGLTYLNPGKTTTRAETATLFRNFYDLYVVYEPVPLPSDPVVSVNRRALIIGNTNAASNNSLYGMKAMMERLSFNGSSFLSVDIIEDETTANIETAIQETFKDTTENDVSYIYLLCKGYPTSDNGSFSLGTDVGTRISGNQLKALFDQYIKGTVVLMLDATNASSILGAFNQETDGDKYFVLCASASPSTGSAYTTTALALALAGGYDLETGKMVPLAAAQFGNEVTFSDLAAYCGGSNYCSKSSDIVIFARYAVV